MAISPLERRLRIAGLLIAAGLLIQAVSLIGVHPLAFVAFLVFACPMVGAGILLFLYSILKGDRHAPPQAAPTGPPAGGG
ncbi:MAG TPA: hypothetical protein VNE16_05300 [Vicinamibacterales bacterium]|nr:hypothetical protein [Vicinamibacterales bacterium]